jgi:hypothetical protein
MTMDLEKCFFNRGVSAPSKPLPGMTRRVLILEYFPPKDVCLLAYTEESEFKFNKDNFCGNKQIR